MSVIEKDKLDGIAYQDDQECIVLLMTDHLDWSNEYEHLSILQDKINSYIQFCESQQYKEIYPDKVVKSAKIEIHFLKDLSQNAEKFLNIVQEQVGELGVNIVCYVDEEKNSRS